MIIRRYEDLGSVMVKPFVLLKMFLFPVFREALLLFKYTSEMLNNNKSSVYWFFSCYEVTEHRVYI